MVEPLAIFGAISATIGLLNLARVGFVGLVKDCEHYQKVGEKITIVQRQINGFLVRLKAWRGLWVCDGQVDVELLEGFWGKEGWQTIADQLTAIDLRCLDIATVLKPFAAETDLYALPETDRIEAIARVEQHARAQRQDNGKLQKLNHIPDFVKRALAQKPKKDTKEQKLAEMRALAQHVQANTKFGKKIKFVISLGEKLEDQLKALRSDWSDLESSVETFWTENHSQSWKTCTYSQRESLALTRLYGYVLTEAVNNRPAIRTLQECCSNATITLKLEIDLLKAAEAGEGHRVRFPLLMPGSDRKLFLLIVEPSGNAVPAGAAEYQKFLDALGHTERIGNCYLSAKSLGEPDGMTLQPHIAPASLYFSLSKLNDNSLINAGKFWDLTYKLKTMSDVERFELAYRIIESGLLLLGTSWMSRLNSATITRFRSPDRPPRYVLSVMKEFQDNVLESIAKERALVEPNIFSIGILLVEIALCTQVVGIKKDISGLNLILGKPIHPALASRQRVVGLVRAKMGDDYSLAVQYCLQDPSHMIPGASIGEWQDTTMSDEEKYATVMSELYNEALVR